MATANSTGEVRPNHAPTATDGERPHQEAPHRVRSTYTAPNPADRPALSTLLLYRSPESS